MIDSQIPWTAMGSVPPAKLEAMRLSAHWAAQIPAALGNTSIVARPDFSHLSLTWDAERRALVTELTPTGWRAGLRIASFSLIAFDTSGKTHELPLAERTLKEGLAWLEARVGVDFLTPPEHDLPAHPVQEGAPFSNDDPAALEELEHWFANMAPLLEEVQKQRAGAAPVRLWPHHFDMATLITLDPKLDAESARSIGVGLSPGDGGTSEPYLYVTPWPYPKDRELPELPFGSWHTGDWIGAVLKGSELVELEDQGADVRAFVRSAIDSAKELLG